MEKIPLVSIIVPVYNVEAYLPKMIDSVLAQTFTDFELLLIDDGTPDNSGKICDEAAARDCRVKAIHKPNGGSASARNEGMKAARGKYFFFVDSDDWIEPEMLATLVNTAEKYQCMLTVTGFCKEYFENGRPTAYDVSPEAAVYLTRDEFRASAYKYFNASYFSVPWCKLFFAAPILEKGLTFREELRQWNDLPFNVDYLMDVDSVVFVPGSMYHYFCSRPGAEGQVVSDANILFGMRRAHFDSILKLYQYWNISDKESMEEIHAFYVGRLLDCIQGIAFSLDLNAVEKKTKIEEILYDSQTQRSLSMARPRNVLMRMAVLPMKWGSVHLCFFEGAVIGFVKNRMANVFYHLRAKIVNQGTVRNTGSAQKTHKASELEKSDEKL